MNVYDFDNTILKGDSSFLFLTDCLKRHPKLILKLPRLVSYAVWFGLGRMEKQTFKQNVFSMFLPALSDPEKEVERFWDETEKRVKAFYRETQKPDDTVISASPEFLIRPICGRLGIVNVMASPVDIRTGRFLGKNCQGEEKPVRFRAIFPDTEIEEFYSDSLNDTPMARIAKKAILVKGEKLLPWPDR